MLPGESFGFLLPALLLLTLKGLPHPFRESPQQHGLLVERDATDGARVQYRAGPGQRRWPATHARTRRATMNESTTRPDCPVGPDDSPTLVTWCDGCGAAGIRSDTDQLDALCADRAAATVPVTPGGHAVHRALQTTTRTGTDPTRRRERAACMTRTHYERGSLPACGAVGEPVTSDLAVVDCAPCLEIGVRERNRETARRDREAQLRAAQSSSRERGYE